MDVEEMRPITLLPELGKLTNRVLARRMTQTLMQHPDLLEGAQRGFLKDGSIVNVLMLCWMYSKTITSERGKERLCLLSAMTSGRPMTVCGSTASDVQEPR